jgi:ectoine hydroxylase-related dioxygenase (phytanoyl-CoA dioxygenase family)
MPVQITESDKHNMAVDGFTVLKDVFSAADMEELIRELEADEARMRADLIAHGGESGISRADEITFNNYIAERNPIVRRFLLRPEFGDICRELIGPDVDLYWNQTVFKHPEGEREFPWHQDDAYTPVTPAPYLTLWLALNDATPENGCVSVLSGSHRDGLRPHEQSSIGLVGYSNSDPDQGVLVPVQAGSIAAFWSLTLHKSGANRSKGIRKAYVIQYSAVPLKRVSDGGLIENEVALLRNGELQA